MLRRERQQKYYEKKEVKGKERKRKIRTRTPESAMNIRKRDIGPKHGQLRKCLARKSED